MQTPSPAATPLRRIWSLFFASLAFVSGHAEGPAVGELVLRDHGELRRFEIAADELEVRGAGAGRGTLRFPAEPSLALLRARTQLRAQQGDDPCLVLYEAGQARSRRSRRVLTRDVVVQLAPGTDAATALAGLPDAVNRGELTCAKGFYRVTCADPAGAPAVARALQHRRGVLDVAVQLARHYELHLKPNDTFFGSQWHLLSTTSNTGGEIGNDLNVTSVWDTYRGQGITIGIIDSGIQSTHADLSANFNATLSHDFVDDDADASPVDLATEEHGTAVAGIAAARGNNGRGVAGVAYEATLAAHRLIVDAPVTDLQIANAFTHRTDAIQIKNNSWGSATSGTNLAYAGTLLLNALAQGADTGRAGRGTIHIFSAGNEGDLQDDVNYDELRSSIYSVCVAATSPDGSPEYYSDGGAALVVAAPGGSPLGAQIVTTDLIGADGYNRSGSAGELSNRDYTKYFAGTSASAPAVAGVVALMLQANPNLGWRDVQEILMRSATKNVPQDPGWTTNAGGLKFHHRFGGGLANAASAVALSKTWLNLPAATRQTASASALALNIPDNNPTGVVVPFQFIHDNLRAEQVQLRLDADHPRRGELVVTLTSPGGTVSRLAGQRGDLNANYKGWTFTSRAHWGEKANGTWLLRVADTVPGTTGVLLAARLEVRGTYADPVRLEANTCTEIAGRSNGNGSPDPGETLRETIRLHNNTSGSLTGLTATLTSPTPGVSILTSTSSYPVIGGDQSAANAVPFEYRLARDLCGTEVQFQLVTQVGGARVTNHCSRLIGHLVEQPFITNTLASSDVPQPVPDVATTLSTNAVPALPGHVLDRVVVSARIDHTAIGDLQIALQHPDGTEVLLSDHEGGNEPNFGTGTCGTDAVPTVFEDAAALALFAGAAPFAGSYRPDEPLSTLNGKPPGGVWRLRLSDSYDEDSGTLRCWSLQTVSHLRMVACDLFDLPPVADPMSINVREGESVEATLTGADADADPLTFFLSTQPLHGALTRFDAQTGAFTYTPAPGYSGPDLFSFGLSDGLSNSVPAVVAITIVSASTNVTLARPFYRPGTGFELDVTGEPAQRYTLEATEDFARWSPVLTNVPLSSPFRLNDLQALQLPHRFYRLRR